MRDRRFRRGCAAALAVPAALCLSSAPSAPAATVLGVEGSGQPKGTTQTAFQGAFCKQNTCRSVNNNRTPFDVALGSTQIHNAVVATEGEVIVMAYSLGAASTYHRLREWAEKPARAPDPDRILIVTFGNPENKYGGDDRNLFWTGLPDVQPYRHLDIAMQYDSVADRPTRWGFFSAINTTFARHFAYFDDVDIDDPDNLVYRDGTTTYMLVRADVLPMLKWLDRFVDDEQMAELDRIFRPLVERDYARPDYIPQGEGADWGNGTPPPSLDDPVEDPEAERRGGSTDNTDQSTEVALARDTPGVETQLVDALTDAAPAVIDAESEAAVSDEPVVDDERGAEPTEGAEPEVTEKAAVQTTQPGTAPETESEDPAADAAETVDAG